MKKPKKLKIRTVHHRTVVSKCLAYMHDVMRMKKPKIRTVHHLSCSGGTIVSKCLSCMQDVMLLSELHPDQFRDSKFNPFDPLQQFMDRTGLRENVQFRRQVFLDMISTTEQAIRDRKQIAIIRDHTHSDYLIQPDANSITSKTSLIDVLRERYEVLSVLTVRNPVDSYISLCDNGWNRSVKSFEDYCSRVLLMWDVYAEKKIAIYKYEDFCRTPDLILEAMCKDLQLEFLSTYKTNFSKIKLSGDSGRAQKSQTIEVLPPREYPQKLIEEARESASYQEIQARYGYTL